MDRSQPLIMNMLSTQMSYATNRQAVLAQNIANIDTPGYGAQDLKKLDFRRMAENESARISMQSTASSHQHGTLPDKSPYRDEKVKKPFSVTPTGNNVVLEEQMAKVSDTGAAFQLSSSLFKKYTQLYRIATGSRG